MKLNKNCEELGKNWKGSYLNQLKQHDKKISYENSQKVAANKAYFYQIAFTVFFNESLYEMKIL